MHATLQKEEFSIAFLHAVASIAGVKMNPWRVDQDSVDLTFTGDRGTDEYSLPNLNVQAKCTETDSGRGDHVTYRLPIKNYDDLRKENVHIPQILVVMCVPKRFDRWIKHTPQQLAMRRCAYWLSLAGQPAALSDADRKVVHLPRIQTFTVEALTTMLRRIAASGRFP